jgi:hypothetical protein
MEEIIELLSNYKSRIDTLMGGASIQPVVATPKILLAIATGDKIMDNKRKVQLDPAAQNSKRVKTDPSGP